MDKVLSDLRRIAQTYPVRGVQDAVIAAVDEIKSLREQATRMIARNNDINDALEAALRDSIVGMERERIERLADARDEWQSAHRIAIDRALKAEADLAAARARIADHEIACTSLCPHGLDIAAEKENLRRERDALAKVPVWAE